MFVKTSPIKSYFINISSVHFYYPISNPTLYQYLWKKKKPEGSDECLQEIFAKAARLEQAKPWKVQSFCCWKARKTFKSITLGVKHFYGGKNAALTHPNTLAKTRDSFETAFEVKTFAVEDFFIRKFSTTTISNEINSVLINFFSCLHSTILHFGRGLLSQYFFSWL